MDTQLHHSLTHDLVHTPPLLSVQSGKHSGFFMSRFRGTSCGQNSIPELCPTLWDVGYNPAVKWGPRGLNGHFPEHLDRDGEKEDSQPTDFQSRVSMIPV